MNVQPTLSRTEDRPMGAHARILAEERHRVPSGPRAFLTWPVEFEVEPWRP